VDLTFTEFHDRISFGHNSPDEEWRNTVGYRPKDKDGGFKRWLELTGNNASTYINEFKKAVYRKEIYVEEEVKQYDLFGN
jgi:hypothetical protein